MLNLFEAYFKSSHHTGDSTRRGVKLTRITLFTDLFISVDRKCGPLSLSSTFRHLVQYVRYAITLLKKLPREWRQPWQGRDYWRACRVLYQRNKLIEPDWQNIGDPYVTWSKFCDKLVTSSNNWVSALPAEDPSTTNQTSLHQKWSKQRLQNYIGDPQCYMYAKSHKNNAGQLQFLLSYILTKYFSKLYCRYVCHKHHIEQLHTKSYILQIRIQNVLSFNYVFSEYGQMQLFLS